MLSAALVWWIGSEKQIERNLVCLFAEKATLVVIVRSFVASTGADTTSLLAQVKSIVSFVFFGSRAEHARAHIGRQMAIQSRPQ